MHLANHSLKKASPKPDQLINFDFAGYNITEHIGKGGMGDVYKAKQIGLNRDVALKILPPMLARNQEFFRAIFF